MRRQLRNAKTGMDGMGRQLSAVDVEDHEGFKAPCITRYGKEGAGGASR